MFLDGSDLLNSSTGVIKRLIHGVLEGEMGRPDAFRLGTSEIGYFCWDISENRVSIDKICAELFEFSPAAGAAGLPIEAFIGKIDPVSRERVAKAIHDNLVEGGFYDEEYSIVLESGASRWVRVTGRMVMDDDGVPIRGMGTMVDVTLERMWTSGLTRQ